jgi:GT2 family glycosyltransferase
MKLVVHIVLFNNQHDIGACLDSLYAQTDIVLGKDFVIEVTDNASTDNSFQTVSNKIRQKSSLRLRIGRLTEGTDEAQEEITLFQNRINMGFCAAHNQGVYRFLTSDANLFLVLNPDTILPPQCLSTLLRLGEKVQDSPRGFIPKLLRTDEDLVPLSPSVLDSTGIIFTSSLRHFDRGAGEFDLHQYDAVTEVEGGSGACLALTRSFITRVILNDVPFDDDLAKVYPWAIPRHERTELFDEAFFAYREDAELSLRARKLGCVYQYLPEWIVYHRRRVTPERRGTLPAFINALGVRNRFLLQMNTVFLGDGWKWWLFGMLARNVIVVGGVLFRERASLRALKEVWILRRRAFARRRILKDRLSAGQ